MKINGMTMLYAISAALASILDQVTATTAWKDLLTPMPVVGMAGAALVAIIAHTSKRPVTQARDRAWAASGKPDRRA